MNDMINFYSLFAEWEYMNVESVLKIRAKYNYIKSLLFSTFNLQEFEK